eukprot:TRINITY_DN23914_c0_g1_i1.p1 TRINITY_DN23914_c0_g1~~TRINITY_DN23914_c0_g1_i1.p1  ORF type:complete len:340 (+),score=57.60 TRINITY_DN23914_c0_g1_i1:96-1115(+)
MGKTVLKPRTIDPIAINPAHLPGFVEDYQRSSIALEENDGFPHDSAWVEKVCESIEMHRLALVKLPAQFAALYERLLVPETFPSVVRDWEVSTELKTRREMLQQDVLPEELKDLMKGWSTVCEHVCKHVTQRLRRLVLGRPLEPPARHECHGQLRIATNCITEPHNDNSYITILGTGKMKDTLKLEVDGREDPADWICAIDFVEEVSTAESESPTFLMYAGSKLCQLDAPVYNPMNHVVDFDRTSTTAPGTERINATYFVRRYDEGYPEAIEDVASSEVQFQYWNRIIMQSELMHRPPRPPPAVRDDVEPDVPEVSAEEAFLQDGWVDWGSGGTPIECF